MKQTKPFGQAYAPVSESPSDAAELPALPQPEAPERSAGPNRPAPAHGARPQQRPPATLASVARKLLLLGVATCLFLTGYVLIRDSVDTVNALEHVHTDDTITECKDGKIEYQGFSIMDRLMGRGTFICTDWHTENRYLHLPKGPHFVEPGTP